MNYPKSTQNEISKYLNAVRKNMQHAPAEEVDEVILHLQEQIDVALEESGDASNEPDHIKRILSTMSQPESFATSTNKEPKGLQWGVVALLTAIVSWALYLGAGPHVAMAGVVWILLIAIAAVAAVAAVFRWKTALGKLAIVILILEAVSFPVIHAIIMELKETEETKQSTELSEPGAEQPATNSKATLEESKETIVLWRVGSPHRGDTPPELVPQYLQELADKQGYAVTVRSFEAKDFHKVFWAAAEKNAEPDILHIDNGGILGDSRGNYIMRTDLGNFTGISAKENIRKSLINTRRLGGWYLLVNTSRNHAKARTLATREPEPVLPPLAQEGMPELAPSEKAAVSKLCIDAFNDSITGDDSSIKAMADDFDSLPLRLWGDRVSGVKVGKVKAYGVSGTDRLALGLVTATVDKPRKDDRMAQLGQTTTLFIFRREHEGEWKLIATRGVGGREPWIWDILKNLRNAKPQEQESVTIETPKLLSPPDGARRPRWPRTQRPDIEWVGGGDDAVKYVVEAQWGSRGTDQWYLSNFDVFSKKAIEQGESGVIKMRAPFGAGAQPHRWRVWAIGPHGETALSQWRRIDFSN
jgi:hypothetical protein